MTTQSPKTLNSSSAPDSTKKRTITGAVHLSSLSMSSSEKLQRLQNTVPSIMHTSSEENPIVTGPMRNSIMDMATARNTNVTDMESLLLLE